MIQILNKKDCCGCSACTQICSKKAISMMYDEEGFIYPIVDAQKCINCGLCNMICPFMNPYQPRTALKQIAYKHNNDEIRQKSSSGGAFTLLAEYVINKGGIIFGAKFNSQWQVEIDCINSKHELVYLRGSKYVQACVNNAYKKCKQLLSEGYLILFTGTPCQIAGLKHFLRKEYDNLLTAEIICHGVPSPLVWDAYLHSFTNDLSEIKEINLRYKSEEGDNYYLIKGYDKIFFKAPAAQSSFSQGFLRHYYLRPSCHSCKAKTNRSHADFTIGDFWGGEKIYPYFYDSLGVSAIIFNSNKACKFSDLFETNGRTQIIDIDDLKKGNPSYFMSTKESSYRVYFWKVFKAEGIAAIEKTKKKELNIFRRIIRKIIKI